MATILALVLLGAVPAQAIPGDPGPLPVSGDNTDLVMTGTAQGQAVAGGIAPVGSTFDPLAGYPTDVPAGFEPLNESFAGIIRAQSVSSGATLSMFCIDIRTSTYPGLGYENGTWDESNVPNVGYIARILQNYFPNTGEPASAPDDNARAAAVQAAIWFFSDSYVLSASDPVRPFTAAIVAAVLEAGPLPEPSPPNLVIDPPTATGPSDTPLGPYTVTSDSAIPGLLITVQADGGTMYTDAAGTVPLANGATIPNGSEVWVRPDAATGGAVTLSARGSARVPSGNVYLYDGNTTGVNDAQRLILAQDAEVSTQTSATADFFQASSLVVTKTVAGAAAGQQGEVTVRVSCDNGLVQDIVVAANAPAGDTSRTIEGLPVGTVCTVTEPVDGSSDGVSVTTSVEGSPVTIAAEEVAAVSVTNTYEVVLSSLVVTKTVAGAAAGQQGEVTVRVSCDNGLVQDIVVAANAPAGDTSRTIEGLPVGTVCTVTEPVDGSSDGVSVTTAMQGNPATIAADQLATVTIVNTYRAVDSGALAVTGGTADPRFSLALGAILLASGAVFVAARIRRRATL
ncbi:thioester domain-containing protein [Microbacterium sp.]|uniref:thioester domain-containing protein n=2 Tax=Microbacterium TaxID=33882 RepID=UPI0028B04713|nr:thioester domain-containing protein [Microbacterium sp.]